MSHRLTNLAATAALLVLPSLVAADTLLVQKQHTDAMSFMGREEPAKDETIELWMGNDRIARRGGSIDTVVRLDEKKLYVIDRADKSYSTISLPFSFMSLVPADQQAMMEQMEKMMTMDVTVTPTDETKQVGSWSAKKYLVTVTAMGMKMDITSWNSTDVEIDYPAYREFIKTSAALQPRADWMQKLASIEGYPVLQEMTMTVMGKSFGNRTQLESVTEKPAPEGTYEPPKDFTWKKFDPMKGLQGRKKS